MKKERFGKAGGKDVFLYELENRNGMKAVISDFGALIVRLYAPDKDGELRDVALGYDTLEEYLDNDRFFGALIAPNANRIGGARFSLNGREYALDVNDGKNNLHSHRTLGSHKRVWEAAEDGKGLLLSMDFPDMDLGFPGNRRLSVRYEVTEDNGLRIDYTGESDRDTVLNPTQHCYFNLDGPGAGQITDHKLLLAASSYTPTFADSIPTGEIAPVEGTPMDFRRLTRIGDRIDGGYEQLRMAGGYDHNWALDGYGGGLRMAARLENGSGSRRMEVLTDLPGIQFYAGNYLIREKGKDGCVYDYRCGLALETQFFPDTPNRKQFPQDIFGPGKMYRSTTVYRFC